MNVTEIKVDRWKARDAVRAYRDSVIARHGAEYEAIRKTYVAIARGKRVIDLLATMKAAGVDAQQRPKLAIARADTRFVRFDRRWEGNFFLSSRERGNFPRPHRSRTAGRLSTWLPLDAPRATDRTLTAIVPIIPPEFLPEPKDLAKYHILWEADWEAAPVDPFLLKRIHGYLYVIVAQWDLTEVERAVIGART